jgi:hypothetical protein
MREGYDFSRAAQIAKGVAAVQGAEKRVFQEATSGAKARPISEDLAARLKSCPSQNLSGQMFFSSLFSR